METLSSSPVLRSLFRANPGYRLQPWLEGHNSGLAGVKFIPCKELISLTGAQNIEHTAAMWISRCADTFKRDPRLARMVLEAEQDLSTDTQVREAAYSTALVQGQPGPSSPQVHYVLSRQGWLRILGDEKMIKACGAGWPDVGWRPPWNVAEYAGFDRQIFYSYQILDHHYREWTPEKEILLFGGEKYKCQDPTAWAILNYTNWKKVLTERAEIAERLERS